MIIGMISLFSHMLVSQPLTQTVRGSLFDVDSNSPLIGATVIVLGTEPVVGTLSQANGTFRFDNIPLGRISLRVSYIGYEDKIIPNVEVNSGKEVILNLYLQESAVKLDEVVIKAYENEGEAINDMAIISSRSISPEKTERFAGGFNDPSRIVSAFAGVATTNDGDNEIIVRGNSPKYIQWRLEGIEIDNPNHFADQNAVKGGVSMLNNNLLATSDFYTGAFSPEFGDALSGVYDVKLRAGNNEQFESTFGFGLLGTDLTLEGPFKKGYGGSYLVNYRYSTISMINDLGLTDIDGLFKFQDAAAKVVLPTRKAGTFSFFGLGGNSSFLLEDVKADTWATPGDNPASADIREDFDKKNYLITVGLNHTLLLNDKSFLKTSLSYSNTSIEDQIFESRDSISNRILDFENNLINSTYRANITYSLKVNAKNKIQIGTKYAVFDYDYDQSWFQDATETRFVAVDFAEQMSTLRQFVSWKHRINEDITAVSGFHYMHVLLNNKNALEPRLALNWKLNPTSTLSVGYGKHSTVESIHNYFAKVENPDGSISEPNQDLDLLKAHHYVLGFEKRLGKQLMAKVEVYYQDLYDIPVENNDTSYYSTLNEGTDYRYVDLVNAGTGTNYGIELTVERFFDDNYYYLFNASLFNSTYTSLEGIERNTQYNGNYLINLLFGKEFTNLGKRRSNTLAINGKIFMGGGKPILPLLRDEQGNLAVDPAQDRYWDYEKAYEEKLEDVYHLILSASYKINRPRATHEIFINLDNLTNTKGKLTEYFDADEPNSIGHLTQFGFFPNLMYRVYF